MKAGIEIHQQLDTGKLFCDCPSEIINDEPDFIIKRKLRAAKGESGVADKAAIHEAAKEKEFHYWGYQDNTCLVEMDEEPPHRMNPRALHAVIEIAKLLKAKVLDNVMVMRKTVIDGSNTSGFQRTALVAVDGHIKVGKLCVNIPSICIEEDAAKIVERKGEYDVYNLSRLGIPLVEIATDPDMKSPEEVKEVAEHIGMLIRSVKGVKRGLGTIRQDVNVSIPKGSRVEIKGAQDLKTIPLLVKNEVMRQENILKIKVPSKTGKHVDVSHVFKKSECKIVSGKEVLAMKVLNAAGVLGEELQPNKRVGTDLSDFAKVKTGIKGLFHSDELPKYGISQKEVDMVVKILELKKKDAFVLVAGNYPNAMHAVSERLKLLLGVPSEVRKANPDGTTSFLRPMPGAARMYPETDLEIIKVEHGKIKTGRTLKDIENDLIKRGFSKDLARASVKSTRINLIEAIIESNKKVKAGFIAEIILSAEKQIRKEFNKEIKIKDNVFIDVFELLDKGKITKEPILNILKDTDKKSVDEIAKSFKTVSGKKLEKEIETIVKNNRGAPFNALMGIVMAKFKGGVSGSIAAKIIQKYIKK